MDGLVDLVGITAEFLDGRSEDFDGCNALILPRKKKEKSECTNKDKQNKDALKLSESQKRKLKKLQEEKEKKARLAESFHILQKHKIQDDAYGFLYSSGNVGQAETMKEKLRRGMQLSRAGLEVPEDVPLLKKRKHLHVSYPEADLNMHPHVVMERHPEQVEPKICSSLPSNIENAGLKAFPLPEEEQMLNHVNKETGFSSSPSDLENAGLEALPLLEGQM